MKKLITTFTLCCFALLASAQAVLPTSWGFTNTTLPMGWTATGTDYYSASGNPAPALKFDGTGDELVINFGSAPGTLMFDIAGNGFAGGTFTVEESDLGSSWTAVQTFTTIAGGGAYNPTTVSTLASTTRYVRFKYTNKVSGNVGLDNVSIAAGAATPAQEINMKFNSATVLNNGTAAFNGPLSTGTPVSFTVENLGTTDVLNITNATITGPGAASYSTPTFPATVAGGATGTIAFTFTPMTGGNHNAVLTIANNDTDENPYIINLTGIGGMFASEPTAQPTALVFSNVRTYRLTGAFTPASPAAEGYLVLIKKGSAMTAAPVDGEAYERGDIVGDARVVSSGTATSFIPTGTLASSDYYVKVFAYNGNGTFRNYALSNAAENNVTTPASTMFNPNYYNGISTASPTFVTDLHNLINPHIKQFYSSYAALMINKFAARDTVDNQKVITCVYSGENKVYTPPFDFSSNNFSREHTYCFSWMPTEDEDLPEYNDYHHLFPTNQNDANAVRSNFPLGNVVTVQDTYLDAVSGLNAAGKKVYEPRDSHKGDAARAMMYEAVCYHGVSGNNWSFPSNISASIPYGQDQLTMKQWSLGDLPDNYEKTRNDYVDSLQHNRNPFVDYPEFICYINFSNMAYEAAGCGDLKVEELLANGFIMFPNPAKTEVSLHVDGTTILGYVIFDSQGRVVASDIASDEILVKVPVSNLKSGAYIVKATTPYGIATKQLIIE